MSRQASSQKPHAYSVGSTTGTPGVWVLRIPVNGFWFRLQEGQQRLSPKQTFGPNKHVSLKRWRNVLRTMKLGNLIIGQFCHGVSRKACFSSTPDGVASYTCGLEGSMYRFLLQHSMLLTALSMADNWDIKVQVSK